MTSWIALLSVFADVVILAALALAVASRGVSQLARLVIATFAFVCAWLLAAGFDAVGARGWTTFVGAAVIVVSLIVMTATLHRWTQGGDGDTGTGHRGAQGGGGPRRRRPDAPQPGGGGAPSWWPDFERQFADYVAEREPVRSVRRVPAPHRREWPLRRT